MPNQQMANNVSMRVINLNYQPMQAPNISSPQQNMVAPSNVSNAFRTTANQVDNAQQVVNMLNTLRQQQQQQQQYSDPLQLTQSPRFANPSQPVNNQPVGQCQQQMASTPSYTALQPNSTSYQPVTSNNPPLQTTNNGYLNNNCQLNNLLNNAPRPRPYRGRARNPNNYTSTGQRVIRDYSRQPCLPNQTQTGRIAELSSVANISLFNKDTPILSQTNTNISNSTGLTNPSLIETSSISNGTQPPVSVSSTTQPASVPLMHHVEIQAQPETFNRACQVDPRPKSMVSRALNATVTVEDASCQTDAEELGYIIVPKKTYEDRACSPIVTMSLQDVSNSQDAPSSQSVSNLKDGPSLQNASKSQDSHEKRPVLNDTSANKAQRKVMYRTKQTAKRRKIQPEPAVKTSDEDDVEIDVLD